MIAAIAAGLVLGLGGAGHCGAMCGPLVALTRPREGARSVARHAALYHAGRVATYLVLGAAAALGGSTIVKLGFGRALTLTAGAWMVASAAGLAVGARGVMGHTVARAITRSLGAAGRWMRSHPLGGPLLVGALNGLLPCGLVYMALAAAAGFGNLASGLAFIVAFGAGTTPVLGIIGASSAALAPRTPRGWRRLAPFGVALVGALLLARGLTNPAAHANMRGMPTAAPHAMPMPATGAGG